MADRGSPTTFDQALVDAILDELSSGVPLNTVLRNRNVPASTFYQWLSKRPELRPRLQEARQNCADRFVDQAVEISDSEPDPQRARVRSEIRRWFASVVRPREYSERLALDVTHAVADPAVLHRDALNRLRAMRGAPALPSEQPGRDAAVELTPQTIDGATVYAPGAAAAPSSAAELLTQTVVRKARKAKRDDDTDSDEPFSIFD